MRNSVTSNIRPVLAGVSPASTAYTINALNQCTAVNTFAPIHDDDGNPIDAKIKGSVA